MFSKPVGPHPARAPFFVSEHMATANMPPFAGAAPSPDTYNAGPRLESQFVARDGQPHPQIRKPCLLQPVPSMALSASAAHKHFPVVVAGIGFFIVGARVYQCKTDVMLLVGFGIMVVSVAMHLTLLYKSDELPCRSLFEKAENELDNVSFSFPGHSRTAGADDADDAGHRSNLPYNVDLPVMSET